MEAIKNWFLIFFASEEFEIMIKVVVAMILSGIIGTERELSSKPAGLRTNVLVGVSATLIMALGIFCSIPLFASILFSTWDGFNKIEVLCTNPKILVAMAFVTCLLTPLMYYGVSMALYKKPYVGKFGRLVYNTK